MHCFFDDRTYTSLKGENEYKTRRFEYPKNSPQFLTGVELAKPVETVIEDATERRTPVLSIHNEEQVMVLKYLKTTDAPADFHDAPFHPDNNLWRFKQQARKTHCNKWSG